MCECNNAMNRLQRLAGRAHKIPQDPELGGISNQSPRAHGTAPGYTLGAPLQDIPVADVSTRLGGEWWRGPGAASNTAVTPRGLAWKAFPPASLQQWATRFGARRLASGCILRASVRSGQRESMASAHIVVHYHELWLKRGNRRFFLHKLREALRRALEGIAIARISAPADRLIIQFAVAAQLEEGLRRLARVSGISHLGVARVLRRTDLDARPLDALCAAAWNKSAA